MGKFLLTGTFIYFLNIVIQILENMLFFVAFLGKLVQVNTALKGLTDYFNTHITQYL